MFTLLYFVTSKQPNNKGYPQSSIKSAATVNSPYQILAIHLSRCTYNAYYLISPNRQKIYFSSTSRLLVLPTPENNTWYKFLGFTKLFDLNTKIHFKTTWVKRLRIPSRTNLRRYISTTHGFSTLAANNKGQWSKGGIPPYFLVKRGYRPNTTAGGARTCHRLPQIQFWRASKVPTDLAEHAHLFLVFSSTSLGLTGPRRTRGLRDPTFWPHAGEVCPRKSTKFIYYPRVTILSPHLTEIIPLHDHLWQPPKRYKHIYTSPYTTARTAQGSNNRRTTGSWE